MFSHEKKERNLPLVECVLDCRNRLGEGPIWSVREQALWWFDVEKPTLWRYDPVARTTLQWTLQKPPAAIALRRDGGMLLLFRRGYLLLEALQTGDAIPDPHSLPLEADRLNDGRVDGAGRMWVGSLARDLKSPVGKLYRFDPAPEIRVMENGFTLGNGMGWNPQRTLMYFADTHSRTIHIFDFDEQTATVSNQRALVTIAGEGGPDGLTVDAHGNVWVAVFGAGAVHCYAADGVLLRAISLPTRYPTSCTFGGADLDTLYVTSASMDLHGGAVSSEDRGGALWAVRLAGQAQGQAEALLTY